MLEEKVPIGKFFKSANFSKNFPTHTCAFLKLLDIATILNNLNGYVALQCRFLSISCFIKN